MKKKRILLGIILISIFFVNPVFADNYTKSYCTGLKSSLRIVGEVVNVIRIAVPLVIIGLACFDLFKAVTAGKDDNIMKSAKSIVTRLILGVLIFFVPAILDFGFSLIDEWTDYETSYKECVSCVLNVSECR